MATRAMFPAGVFSVGGAVMEDEGPNLSDLPRNNLPVPQLVLLASPAPPVSGGSGSTGEDGASCDGLMEEKEMVELRTVGCSYSDSEGESVRYSYDQQNRVEFCVVEYVESPAPWAPGSPGARAWTPAPGSKVQDDQEEEQEANEREGATVKDLSKPPDTPGLPAAKRKSSHAAVVESTKKKKPFHCKPCNYQADNEEAFVEHLGTHALSKRVVLNRVEGRSKARAAQAGGPTPPPEAGGAEGGAGDMGDSKGVIRCERCGYNTNRYDHYVAHLKHHSKEGEDQRVFKCTLCPYTTVSQYHWRKHLRNHFPSKLHTCDQCSYFSDRKSNYIQHIRKHTGMRPFRCLYCEYSSSQKTHLTRHMRTHSGERPFKCDSCNYLAANQHEVTRHARQVHNGPKPLACPYCQYKTADRSNFKKHVELHLNPRQFHCPLCKYAASKKCNLQYHIKSRHVGCDIPIDVSKVKLRVKKGSEDAADHLGRSKSKEGKSLDDEEDGDDFESDEGELASKQEPTPISLSSKKSGEHAQVPENDVETDRVQKKAKTAAALKDKGAPGSKEKAVGKVTTRQKKVARVSENTKEKCSIEEGPVETPAAPVRSREAKVKRCTKKKKLLLKEKSVSGTDGLEGTDPEGGDEAANPNGEQAALQRSMEEMKKLQKEKRIEKMRKAKQEKDEPETSFKTNKRIHARRTGARKPNKDSEPLVEDVPHGPAVTPGDRRQLGKDKVGKRKAIEALDLSTKHSSAEAPTVEYPSPKKSKTITADKPATKPSSSQEVSQTAEPRPALEKDLQIKAEAPNPMKLKKTRKICKKKPVLQESPVSTKDQQDSVTEDPFTPPAGVSSTQLQSDMTQPPPDTHPEQNPTEAQVELHHNKMAPQERTSSAPEKKARQISRATEVASTSRGSGEEKMLCPVTDRHTAPLFRRPGAKAPQPSLEIPRPAEEDEGIHSSHEGTSDASDSASEGGSEDSGLNSAGAGSGKMPNDPETPTDEIPTPTELKSHLCVFCDRTFPLEVEYRRHVNRHLVNVYDRDSPAANTGK